MSDAYTLHEGEALEVLQGMEEGTVDCMVGSPPYFGLRSYAGAWRQCALWRVPPGREGEIFPRSRDPKKSRARMIDLQLRAERRGGIECPVTGARIDALGGEPTVQLYIEHLVEIMAQVWRVLKPSGTAWVVIADSYAAHPGQRRSTDPAGPKQRSNAGSIVTFSVYSPGLKPKDLCLVPQRLALALQADGWWVRNAAVWQKFNPMPSSDPHKLTPSCETILFLAKDGREVWADTFDARLPHKSNGRLPGNKSRCYVNRDAQHDEHKRRPSDDRSYHPAGKNPRDTIILGREDMHRWLDEQLDAGAATVTDLIRCPAANSREEHFATYPELIATVPVLVGCPPRVCATCGEPMERVTEVERTYESGSGRAGNLPTGKRTGRYQGGGETVDVRRGPCAHFREAGWTPRCACDAGHVPGLVLDPFLGSGTTGIVALREGRRFVGVEVSPEYAVIARRRMDALVAGHDRGRPVHPEEREATTPAEVQAGQMMLLEAE